MKHYTLTYEQLYADLYQAYMDARRHKRNRPYQLRFEECMDSELKGLCDELWNRSYKARPCFCFIINEPTKREIFAADFRDRIVHHLYYNYVHELFERTFIQDSYSCIKGRGTHYGIKRLQQHIRQCSQNYQYPCYVMKMDIRGYFMHINRELLLEITINTLRKMANRRVGKTGRMWCELVDMSFVEYLTDQIVRLNPVENSLRIGKPVEWESLPKNKSLFYSKEGCGLPIGNLTSQLFSNVYLNCFDQYMKRNLKCTHYGRYVDDFYIVSPDREWLRSLVPIVRVWLDEHLGLTLHEGKIRVCNVNHGVGFLGAWLKPWRNYICNSTLKRMNKRISQLGYGGSTYDGKLAAKDSEHLVASLNSYMGVLSHYKTYRIRESITQNNPRFSVYGSFVDDNMKFVTFV